MSEPKTPDKLARRDSVVPGDILLPFALVTTLFALWGFANDVTNPLVKAFQEIFLISNQQSSLVQTAFYGGYATMALPAAIFIRRFSYKAGILLGLALYATGALLFIPASIMMEFWLFLVALYVLTFGLAFLETTANPYILAMGPVGTATRRLNFAQAFNPIGSLIGMIVASQVVLAGLGVQEFRNVETAKIQVAHKAQYEADLAQYQRDPSIYQQRLEQMGADLKQQEEELADLDEKSAQYGEAKAKLESSREAFENQTMPVAGEYKPMLPGRINGKVMAALHQYADGDFDFDAKDKNGAKKYQDHKAMQAHDLAVVRLPYVVIGIVIIAAFVIFAVSKLPKAGGQDKQVHFFVTFGRLLKNERYVGGVIAQTFYVGAQIMCWTFIIHYAMINLNMSIAQAQRYNIIAMVIFCSSRFICTYLLKYVSPGGLLTCLALGGMLLTLGAIFVPGMAGLYCLIGISACMSLMFPTIYGIALDGLGEDAKLGSAGLIFAIVGGALMPPLQGRIIDMGDFMGNVDLGFLTMTAVSASFVLPFICFVVIAVFGFRTFRAAA